MVDVEPINELELLEQVNPLFDSDFSPLGEPPVPRFEENRHEGVKLFVSIWSVGALITLILQAFWNIPRQYDRVFCELSLGCEKYKEDSSATFSELVTVGLRFYLEVVVPFGVLLVLIMFQLSLIVIPKLSTMLRNPIPTLLLGVYFDFTFYTITNFSSSINMLTSLSRPSQRGAWSEYFLSTAMGLFWMFSFLIMQAFSRLTTYSLIRARENYQMQLVNHRA